MRWLLNPANSIREVGMHLQSRHIPSLESVWSCQTCVPAALSYARTGLTSHLQRPLTAAGWSWVAALTSGPAALTWYWGGPSWLTQCRCGRRPWLPSPLPWSGWPSPESGRQQTPYLQGTTGPEGGVQGWTTAATVTTAGPQRSCRHNSAPCQLPGQQCRSVLPRTVLTSFSCAAPAVRAWSIQSLHGRGLARQPTSCHQTGSPYEEQLGAHALGAPSRVEAIGEYIFASPRPVSSGYMSAEGSCDAELQAQQNMQLSIARLARLPHEMRRL